MDSTGVATPIDTLARLQQMLGAARQGVIFFNPRGGVAYASDLAVEIFQIDENSGRIGATLAQPDGTRLDSLCSPAAKAGALILTGPEGQRAQRIVRVNAALPDGILVQDVSDEVRRGAGERAYLDIVAHDLRAGLVPAKTYAQMLQAGILGPVTEKQGDALRAIDHCVERQTDKIGSVLDTIKAEENRLELVRDPINLADLVNKAIAYHERDLTRRDVQALRSVEGSPLIDGDMPRLQRVVSALLGRCVRAAPRNSHVGVELRHLGEFIRLRCWDQGGPGSAEDLRILRSSVRQQHEQRLSDGARPNLELAPIHDIVALHGGRLGVHSDETGTTYLLYLPASRKSLPEERMPPRRALVVAGDAREREALEQPLLRSGFEVFATGAADEAQRAARERHYPLVVVSDTTENADIWKLQAQVREQRPEESHAICVVLREVEQARQAASGASIWMLSGSDPAAELQRILPDVCRRARIASPDSSPPSPCASDDSDDSGDSGDSGDSDDSGAGGTAA